MKTLAQILGDAIAAKAETDAERAALVARMAAAAGIETTTVNQILRGEIETPPEDRLRGFAEVLDLPLGRLTAAAPQPGRRISRTFDEKVESASQSPAPAVTGARPEIALGAALPIAPPALGAVPEWVHVMPAGLLEARDGRGPWRLDDPAAVIAASLADERGVAVDENHATDLAAREGRSTPALGWIEEMQAHPDGIWARVAWNRKGAALVADRAYRHVSPVFVHDRRGRVRQILRVSLVNIPNLRGLTALNMETDMDLLARLIETLGLDASADEAQAIEAVEKLRKPAADAAALNAGLAEIGAALGVEGGDPARVLAAARTAGRAPDAVVALQAELTAVAGELAQMREASARRAAEGFVDANLDRAGVKPLRDHYIAMHMADPARVEKEIGAMPRLTGAAPRPAQKQAGGVVLSAEQLTVARMLGQKPEDYAATLASERAADEEAV